MANELAKKRADMDTNTRNTHTNANANANTCTNANSNSNQRRYSNWLETEAADYFKLDLDQVNLFSQSASDLTQQCQNQQRRLCRQQSPAAAAPQTLSASQSSLSSTSSPSRFDQEMDATRAEKKKHCSRQPSGASSSPKRVTKSSQSSPKMTATATATTNSNQTKPATRRTTSNMGQRQQANKTTTSDRSLSPSGGKSGHRGETRASSGRSTSRLMRAAHDHQHQLGYASPGSTSSLPSISSSPSVSPSLVCPHLSLDDLLGAGGPTAGRSAGGGGGSSSVSPHTIGLCPRCRLDPPPNVHSPLSPLFRPTNQKIATRASKQTQWCTQRDPHLTGSLSQLASQNNDDGAARVPCRAAVATHTQTTTDPRFKPIRRAQSDHHQQQRRRRVAATYLGNKPPPPPPPTRHRGQQQQQRDDSLDYCLAPEELRRLQMSPSLRNSVEFIRNNHIESGRVVRIYKNGRPYDRPLRVCIMRGEFASLNHLLDHINTRQLIACGARYLFHLDGQLVYSVHELKHGSIYIVSGTRTFDLRANAVLRDQLTREKGHQYDARRGELVDAEPTAAAAAAAPTPKRLAKQRSNLEDQTIIPASASLTRGSRPASPLAGGARQTPAAAQTEPTRWSPKPSSAAPGAIPAQEAKQAGGGRLVKPAGGSRLVRAKSEMDGLRGKQQQQQQRKKMVTFMDPVAPAGRGSSPVISELVRSSMGDEATCVVDAHVGSHSFANGGPERAATAKRGPEGDDDDDNQSPPLDASRLSKSLSTNEIGIQVSDSIDGYLIDLPLPMPAKRDDANLYQSKRQSSARGSSSSSSTQRRTTSGTSNGKPTPGGVAARQKPGAGPGGPRRPRQIVTIAERQLSLDEMSQFKDLDHGDHHHELTKCGEPAGRSQSKVTIKLDEEGPAGGESDQADGTPRGHLVDGLGGGGGRQKPVPAIEQVSKSAAAAAAAAGETTAANIIEDPDRWQYPAGRETCATPTERPVSQSGPNESMRAQVRVSSGTPSPSVSASEADNLSSKNVAGEVGVGVDVVEPLEPPPPPPPPPQPPAPRPSAEVVEAPTKTRPAGGGQLQQRLARSLSSMSNASKNKQQVDIMGRLHAGLDCPARNFKLLWVNGFTINDLYPENCSTTTTTAHHHHQTNETNASRDSHLVPQQQHQHQQQATTTTNPPGAQFKPSERFHNWACYSHRYSELLYPAGCLVVLWSRITNGQRYYGRHLANVTAVALSSLDLNLAASGQVCDPSPTSTTTTTTTTTRKPSSSTGGQIHLWSLKSLDTLMVIDEGEFRTKRIFSLRLRNSPSAGFELTVGAREDKQLYVYSISGQLSSEQQPEDPIQSSVNSVEQSPSNKQQIPAANRPAAAAAAATKGKRTTTTTTKRLTLVKSSKALQVNQQPLLVLPVPIEMTRFDGASLNSTTGQSAGASSQKEPTTMRPRTVANQFVLSFGRRHLGLWFNDKKQLKLRPCQVENKSAKLVELLVKSNCIIRLSPNELILGNSDGDIVMLLLNFQASKQQPSQQSPRFKSTPAGQGHQDPAGATNDLKFSYRSVVLTQVTQHNSGGEEASSITSLTRISGNLFISGDSSCTLRFWQIKRQKTNDGSDSFGTIKLQADDLVITCNQVTSISLPTDLGLICALILAKFDRRKSLVEFYIMTTSNTILFGSIQLQLGPSRSSTASGSQDDNNNNTNNNNTNSLSVVYEGHETAVTCLVADIGPQPTGPGEARGQEQQQLVAAAAPAGASCNDDGSSGSCYYFTCSIDCRICRWYGKQLVWKSLLPSSCSSLAVHPVGPVLAVGSTDGTVYILNKSSGLLISYFPLTPVRINCLAYSQDGALLAAGCVNGSIFILPVYERGHIYKKVSIFQSPNAVVSLQFSEDNRYILTSVTHGSYQELILWDLPNFRYMRDNVKLAADKIKWYDSICSGSEDVRAIWENANMAPASGTGHTMSSEHSSDGKRVATSRRPGQNYHPLSTASNSRQQLDQQLTKPGTTVNLSCHRLVRSSRPKPAGGGDVQVEEEEEEEEENYVIASDTSGYLRLFKYPCYDIQQGFYAIRISSTPVNCCRFLTTKNETSSFISSSMDGSICLWKLV